MSEMAEFVPVRAAAAVLGVSERTIWRHIRCGELPVQRRGRRVFVLVSAPEARELGRAPGHRAGEAVAPYTPTDDWVVGAFPYTAAVVERHCRAKLARRRAALAEIRRLAALSAPDPDGLTGADYIRAERDHPRALEGGDAADRALEELARERHRPR